MVKMIFLNPITMWLLYLYNRIRNRIGNPGKNLFIDYMSFCNNVRFGTNNQISRYAVLNNVDISDFSYVSSFTRINNASIGKYCSIGPNCLIGLGRHPTSEFVSTHPVFYSLRRQAGVTFAQDASYEEVMPITIGNDAWIGAAAIVLDGVKIGNGAIVSAGSVVNKDVPDYAIVGGVPAKVIRYRFSEQEIGILLNEQWWNKDEQWLKQHAKSFHNIEDYFQASVNHAHR